MADKPQIKRGNSVRDFKPHTADLKLETDQVKAWKQRIRHHYGNLKINSRREAVEKGDKYIDGTMETKNGRTIYLRYLPTLLEDMYRETLPKIPEPRINARNERGEMFEAQAKQIVQTSFANDYCRVRSTMKQLLREEAKWSVAFAKTEWVVDSEPTEPEITQDAEQIDVEVDRAMIENDDPFEARVADGDLDAVHMRVHSERFGELPVGSEEYAVLQEHMDAHQARMTVIRRERPVLRMVGVERFVYDTDRPWELRGWDAELKTERIADLFERGYKNLNKQNIQPEERSESGNETPFEDLTVRVWDIHDRRNGARYVIAHDGPDQGLFLYKGGYVYGAIDTVVPMVFHNHNSRELEGVSTVQSALPILDALASVDYYIKRHVETHCDYKLLMPTGSDASRTKADLNDPNKRFVSVNPEAMAGMKEWKPPSIPDTLLEFRQTLLSELRRVTSVDAQDIAQSNPHKISATESARRGIQSDVRITDRQEIAGDFLAQVAKNFLSLYKKFATEDITARIVGPMGVEYKAINPTDVPDELDVYLDVHGESNSVRQERSLLADQVVQFLFQLPQMGMPVDINEVMNFYLSAKSVQRPDRFRDDAMQMPMLPGGEQKGQASQPRQPNDANPNGEPNPAGPRPDDGDFHGNIIPFPSMQA